MRILVAGDWHSALHEEPVYQAFKTLGHEVFRFSWHQYFQSAPRGNGSLFPQLSLVKKFQNKYMIGPAVNSLNNDFLGTAAECRPDLIFVYRGTHLFRETIEKAKQIRPDSVAVGYNNDDPYAKGYPFWFWRHFLRSIPAYDIILAYRLHNLDDFRRAGAKKVGLLRSWFIPERNHPVELSSEELRHFGCDVVFAGHYEPDGRRELLEEVVRAGFHLRVFGPGYDWDPVLKKSKLLRHLVPVRLVWGEEYNKALCGAKVALCFLSKLNRDTYTRRCFEIPATGTMMLSEFTEDQASLFREGIEADYFRSPNELVHKLRMYVQDDLLRRSVGDAGRRKVNQDGHDVISRMKYVLSCFERIRGEAAWTPSQYPIQLNETGNAPN